jgi:hypothetical protein
VLSWCAIPDGQEDGIGEGLCRCGRKMWRAVDKARVMGSKPVTKVDRVLIWRLSMGVLVIYSAECRWDEVRWALGLERY